MMHEPEDAFDWKTECPRVYRKVIKDRAAEGIGRSEAINIAREQILGLIADGSVTVPIHEAIDATLYKADAQDQRSTDKALRTLAFGQPSFDVEGDPILDLTVILGGGLRKVYRYVTVIDLDQMNEERNKARKRADSAYNDKWQPIYAVWRPILQRHATLGDAVDAGDLPSGLDDAA